MRGPFVPRTFVIPQLLTKLCPSCNQEFMLTRHKKKPLGLLSQTPFSVVSQHFGCCLCPQVGWSTARDYYTFLWSPMPENYEPGSTVHRTVVFQGAHTHYSTHTHRLFIPLCRPRVFQSHSSILQHI